MPRCRSDRARPGFADRGLEGRQLDAGRHRRPFEDVRSRLPAGGAVSRDAVVDRLRLRVQQLETPPDQGADQGPVSIQWLRGTSGTRRALPVRVLSESHQSHQEGPARAHPAAVGQWEPAPDRCQGGRGHNLPHRRRESRLAPPRLAVPAIGEENRWACMPPGLPSSLRRSLRL